ncbi:hypothetical protein [Lactobacillus sp. ESL0681]|uniref:LiaF transmembrane domain-containing protein n=1 Tax=Lactobacillus sp. ESL0681 TaxID=2983211 RepID=UPI0023F9F543|nr:hypothetical protein [Lactobacillus sp. ESL0681]WEV39879.1 hypothetical protein OZX59_06620 [Lactobacillus sp. ESL0681]
MKKHKIKEIFWGLTLLAAAAFLVMNQLNLLAFQLNFWTVLWTIIFGACLIAGIVNKSITATVFSMAFLLIIYAKPLKITRIVPWTVLLAACLISVGLHLIFTKHGHKTHVYVNGHEFKGNWTKMGTEKSFHADHIFGSDSKSVDDADIVISQRMSDVSRYVHSQNLCSVTINSLMGNAEVYLDAATPAGDTVMVNINSSMSEISIYIPLAWQVDDQLTSVFGEVEVRGTSSGEGPTLVLTGSSKLGNVNVNYI